MSGRRKQLESPLVLFIIRPVQNNEREREIERERERERQRERERVRQRERDREKGNVNTLFVQHMLL